MNLYVGNLSYEVTAAELEELFGTVGTVKAANIISDRYSGESRGFGFVEIESKDEAKAAIEQMDGKELKGKKIIVNEAKPRADNRGGGGGGRRGGGGGGGYGNRGGGGGGRRY